MKEALEQVVDPLRAPVSVSCCCPGAAKMPVLRQRHDAHRLKSLGHSNREMARQRNGRPQTAASTGLESRFAGSGGVVFFRESNCEPKPVGR